jgi:hypothetical protein
LSGKIGMSEGISSVASMAVTALPSIQSAGRKLSFRMQPSVAVYASFKHIQVIPDSTLKGGIPLYKLTLLDRLIEMLSGTPAAGMVEGKKVTAESIDRVIGDITQRLRGGSVTYQAGLQPGTGLVVDMVA